MAWNAMPFRLLAAGLVSVALLASAAAASALPPTPSVPPAPPAISGSAVQGATLSCSPGGWLNATSYSYSWQRNVATPIGTGSTYTLTSSDVGAFITCSVTAYNGSTASPVAQTSMLFGPVGAPVPGAPLNESPPVISGAAVEGQVVTCSQGAWLNASSYSYSWQRDVSTPVGSNSAYTLTAGDVGQLITCTVIASNSAGSGPSAVSLPVVPVAASGSGGGGSGGPGSVGSGAGGAGSAGGTGGSGSGSHGGTKAHAPTIKSFSIVPGRVIVLVKGKRQSTKGATFRYTLDERAGVLIALEQRQTGRLKGKKCAATTRRNAKAKHCTRWVTVKLLAVKSAKAGASKLKYAGWIGKRLLATGSYRAVVGAVNTGGWSKTRSTSFTVVHRSARPRARAR